MIEDWRHALAALSTEPPRLVVRRPPEWWFTTRDAKILARPDDTGAVALKIPAREARPSLVIIDRGAALDTTGALVTGDDRFERAVAVFCDDPLALGLFDHDTRRRLIDLVARGGSVIAGELYLPPAHDPSGLDDALALARALALTPNEAGAQLARIANDDPREAVRDHYLDVAQALGLGPRTAKTHRLTFDKLAAQLTSGRGRAERLAALQTLLRDYDIAAVAALPASWHEFAGRDLTVFGALHDAYARDPSATLDLAQLIFAGRFDALPAELAEALIELMPLAMTTASLAQWFQLARHEDKRLAHLARSRIGSLPEGVSALAAALRDPGLAAQLTRDEDLTSHLLSAAIERYPDASELDQRHTRQLVRTFGARNVLAARAGFLDEWPAAKFALAMIGAHHDADDPEANALYRMLVDHDDLHVRRRALVMLLDLPSVEALPSNALLADIIAAALDPSGPRHGGKVLVRHFPRDNRPSQLQFLDAFARVGTSEHLPFLLGFLDDDDSAIVCRALKAIGNIADPAVVPRLKPLTTGFFRDGDVKDAASAAIEAIQARGAPRGALSMSDAGGLALDD